MNTNNLISKPIPALIDAVDYLHKIAIEVAQADGFEFHTDQSNCSEAVYCTIRRGRYWYGIRIAAHEPAYVCSADYLQILVPPKVAELTTLSRAERQLRHAIRHGGRVVADPGEVNAALVAATETYFQQTGRIELPNSDACAIRHRLHFRARWIYDEEQTVSGRFPEPNHCNLPNGRENGVGELC